MKGTSEERMYLVFTRMPCENYRRRFRYLLWRFFDVFRALINSLWLLIYMSTLNRPHSVSVYCNKRDFVMQTIDHQFFSDPAAAFNDPPPPPPQVSPPAVAVSEKPTLSSGEGWRRKDRPMAVLKVKSVFSIFFLKAKSVFLKRMCVCVCVCVRPSVWNLCKISVYPVTDTDSTYNRRTIVNTWRRIRWEYATGTQSVENMPPVPSPLRIFHRYPVRWEYSTGTQSVYNIPPVPSPLRIFHRYQVRSEYCTGTQSVQNIQCFPPVPSPFRIFSGII